MVSRKGSPSFGPFGHKLNLFQKNFNFKAQINFDQYLLIGSSEENIFPCKCLIPVHVKCVFNLLLISQSIKCPLCTKVITLYTKRSNVCSKFFNKNFILQNILYVFLIIAFTFIIAISQIHNFNKKFDHIRYILLFFFQF